MTHTLISTHTASSSATLDITSGIDSTYSLYEFHCVNLHPQTDDEGITFQVNAAGGSGFNETVTSSFWRAKNHEDDSAANLSYVADYDLQAGTGYIRLCNDVGADNDQSVSGVLRLYAPSNTTFTKHFQSRMNENHASDITMDNFVAGIFNTTSAIDEISFKFSSGNIDTGVIKMFGVV